MLRYKKSFDFTASDDELYDYVEKMIDVMVGDIDPKVEFDFESDENHRYVNFKILNYELNQLIKITFFILRIKGFYGKI